MLSLCLVSHEIFAHISPPQKGSLNFANDGAYLTISLPVSLFPDSEKSHKSEWSDRDLTKNNQLVTNKIKSCLQLNTREREVFGNINMVSLNKSDPASDQYASQVFALIHYPLEANELTENNLFSGQYQFKMNCFGEADHEKLFNITVLAHSEQQALILSAEHPSENLFPSAIQVIWDYIQIGFTHITEGYDHILFIVTLMISAFSIRRWLLILTSFSLAHAITFSLATLGYTYVSPSIVEPSIAVTILLVAVMNLTKKEMPLTYELLIVFGFGLIHGLGFSSALGTSVQNFHMSLYPILGFNLGVELGQILIVSIFGSAFLILGSSRHVKNRVVRLMNYFVILISLYWIFTRLG